jgi:hypothetical protein
MHHQVVHLLPLAFMAGQREMKHHRGSKNEEAEKKDLIQREPSNG